MATTRQQQLTFVMIHAEKVQSTYLCSCTYLSATVFNYQVHYSHYEIGSISNMSLLLLSSPPGT